MQKYVRIGIDVGGTNTDAVLLEGTRIVAIAKMNTTADIAEGVVAAIEKLFEHEKFPKHKVDAIMIGTTHFVNSVLQAKGLNEVLVVRLAKPATTALEPLADWPESLQTAVGEYREIIGGGYEYNGKAIAELDCARLKALAGQAKAKSIKAAAITGVFAHVNPDQENVAYEILKSISPELQITLSHKVGGLSLLPRENAAILNAALTVQFKHFYDGIKAATVSADLSQATLYFSSNDGTLENPQDIFPITTYGSGPSNSMRGAAVLAKVANAIVVDVGGTSTDVGILKNGFPLESGYEVKVGNEEENIVCNFPAPLTRSCALGGGSKITVDAQGKIKVGPESVGYQLKNEAIVFGGKTLTVTDIAVAKGRLKIGNPEYLKAIDQTIIDKVDEFIHFKVIELVNLILLFAKCEKNIPLILVGGGARLFDQQLLSTLSVEKISYVEIPQHAENANALGAAIAKVSGNFNGVFQYSNMVGSEGMSRQQAIEFAKSRAMENAIAKGAHPSTIEEQEINETPINYLPGNQTKLHIKVIGEMKCIKE